MIIYILTYIAFPYTNPEEGLALNCPKKLLWEKYDAHSKRTCSTDSLQAPQLGHSCDPLPLACLPNSLNMGKPNETLKTIQKVLPLHILNTPQTQSSVSILFKLAIWIYAVRPFQTPHILFYQGFFGLVLYPILCLGDLILSLKNAPR